MYLFWYVYVYVLNVFLTYESAPLSLDVLISLIHWFGPPPLLLSAAVWILLCSVTRFATVALLCILCIYIYRCFSPPRVPSPTPLVCSHYTSNGEFSFSVVAILSVPVPWLPYMIYIAYVLKEIMHFVLWTYCFTDFEYAFEIDLYFFKCLSIHPLARPSCLTYSFGTQVQVPLSLRRRRPVGHNS